ncbi:MAG: hypothetical protein QXI07_11605 [Pyrobaculum sp.]
MRPIVFGGPPKAGKSTLLRKIYERYQFSVRIFLLEANPDGEGFWCHWGVKSSQQAVKKELFNRFMEMMHHFIRYFFNLRRVGYTPLVSLGGKISAENAFFLSAVSQHAPIVVVLARNLDEQTLRWAHFANEFADTIITASTIWPLRYLNP